MMVFAKRMIAARRAANLSSGADTGPLLRTIQLLRQIDAEDSTTAVSRRSMPEVIAFNAQSLESLISEVANYDGVLTLGDI